MKTKIFIGVAYNADNAQNNANDLCTKWIKEQQPKVTEKKRTILNVQQKPSSIQWVCNLQLEYR